MSAPFMSFVKGFRNTLPFSALGKKKAAPSAAKTVQPEPQSKELTEGLTLSTPIQQRSHSTQAVEVPELKKAAPAPLESPQIGGVTNGTEFTAQGQNLSTGSNGTLVILDTSPSNHISKAKQDQISEEAQRRDTSLNRTPVSEEAISEERALTSTAREKALETLHQDPEVNYANNLADIREHGTGPSSPAYHRFRMMASDDFDSLDPLNQDSALGRVHQDFMMKFDKEHEGGDIISFIVETGNRVRDHGTDESRREFGKLVDAFKMSSY